jgi:hypothetical protein
MLFSPFAAGTHHYPHFRKNILYNHNLYNGEEAALCFSGLNDLQTMIKIKTTNKFQSEPS